MFQKEQAKFNRETRQIHIPDETLEKQTREGMTSILLHEMVHASSPTDNSIQEEANAFYLREKYLDLFAQGEYQEDNLEKFKHAVSKDPFYKHLNEYSQGHGEK
ncbi:MAG: hypothetical protein MZU97_02030 [Bacillus subtilis]|nr:hypothetical protein [Bacillus subtilis]